MPKVSDDIRCLRDKFREVVIMGTGPTTVDYEEMMPQIHEPIFFINAAHRYSEMCASKHQYFVTHHISEYFTVRPVSVFIEKMVLDCDVNYSGTLHAKRAPTGDYIPVQCQAVDEVITAEFLSMYPHLLDKDEVDRRNMLLAGFGSATTAIHAAWYAGCRRVAFIGCNPDVLGTAKDARFGGRLNFEPDKVKENNRRLPKLLNLNVTHW